MSAHKLDTQYESHVSGQAQDSGLPNPESAHNGATLKLRIRIATDSKASSIDANPEAPQHATASTAFTSRTRLQPGACLTMKSSPGAFSTFVYAKGVHDAFTTPGRVARIDCNICIPHIRLGHKLRAALGGVPGLSSDQSPVRLPLSACELTSRLRHRISPSMQACYTAYVSSSSFSDQTQCN